MFPCSINSFKIVLVLRICSILRLFQSGKASCQFACPAQLVTEQIFSSALGLVDSIGEPFAMYSFKSLVLSVQKTTTLDLTVLEYLIS